MFPFIRGVAGISVDHLPHIEHTQLLAEDREILIATIEQRVKSWLKDNDRSVKSTH